MFMSTCCTLVDLQNSHYYTEHYSIRPLILSHVTQIAATPVRKMLTTKDAALDKA